MQILLVEDDPVARLAICQHLLELGHDVIVATDGREGMLYIALPFDLILLDIGLPRIDGNRLARIIRETETRRNTVVAITNDRTGGAVNHFDAIYRKPISRDDILTILRLGTRDEKEETINDERGRTASRRLRPARHTQA